MDFQLTPAQRGALETMWSHFGQEGIAEPHYPPDVIRMLRKLQEIDEELIPNAAYQWAVEKGWKQEHAQTLRTYATVVEYWNRGGPLAADVVDQWRRRGEGG